MACRQNDTYWGRLWRKTTLRVYQAAPGGVKYSEFIKILTDYGFKTVRQNGSHRIYEGYVSGRRCLVTVAYHKISDEIRPKTFKSMIRQSTLDANLFNR